MHRKAQTWSIEAYIAVSIFLMAMIVFYAMIGLKASEKTVQKEAEKIAASLPTVTQFENGEIDASEAVALESLNCDDMKQLLSVGDENKKVCLYMKDENGNLVDFSTKKTVGCGAMNDGLEVAPGIWCGRD